MTLKQLNDTYSKQIDANNASLTRAKIKLKKFSLEKSKAEEQKKLKLFEDRIKSLENQLAYKRSVIKNSYLKTIQICWKNYNNQMVNVRNN